MKYVLLAYIDEKCWKPGEQQACYEESAALAHDLHAKRQLLGASPLHAVTTATSVRVREGKRLVSDGPFAETHEHLGGFYLVDIPDLDQAIAIAARIPGARKGTGEVRPVLEISNLPTAN